MTYGGAPAPPTIAKAVTKLPGGNVAKYVHSLRWVILFFVVLIYASFACGILAPKVGSHRQSREHVLFSSLIRIESNFSLSKGYGLTETTAGVINVLGADSAARPLSAFVCMNFFNPKSR